MPLSSVFLGCLFDFRPLSPFSFLVFQFLLPEKISCKNHVSTKFVRLAHKTDLAVFKPHSVRNPLGLQPRNTASCRSTPREILPPFQTPYTICKHHSSLKKKNSSSPSVISWSGSALDSRPSTEIVIGGGGRLQTRWCTLTLAYPSRRKVRVVSPTPSSDGGDAEKERKKIQRKLVTYVCRSRCRSCCPYASNFLLNVQGQAFAPRVSLSLKNTPLMATSSSSLFPSFIACPLCVFPPFRN